MMKRWNQVAIACIGMLLAGALSSCTGEMTGEPLPPNKGVDSTRSQGTSSSPTWTLLDPIYIGGVVRLQTLYTASLTIDSVLMNSRPASFVFAEGSRRLIVSIPSDATPGNGDIRVFSNSRHSSSVSGEFRLVAATMEDAVFTDSLQLVLTRMVDAGRRHSTSWAVAAEDSTLQSLLAEAADVSQDNLDELHSLSHAERGELAATLRAMGMSIPALPEFLPASGLITPAGHLASIAAPGRSTNIYTGDRCRTKLGLAANMAKFNEILATVTSKTDEQVKQLERNVPNAAEARKWSRAFRLAKWIVEMNALDVRLSTATLLVPRPADMGGALTFRDRAVTAEGGREPVDPIVLLVRRGPPWTDVFLATASSPVLKRLSRELSAGIAVHVTTNGKLAAKLAEAMSKMSDAAAKQYLFYWERDTKRSKAFSGNQFQSDPPLFYAPLARQPVKVQPEQGDGWSIEYDDNLRPWFRLTAPPLERRVPLRMQLASPGQGDTSEVECIPTPATSLPENFGSMHLLAYTSRVQLNVGGSPTIPQDGVASAAVTVRNPFTYPIDVTLQLASFEIPGVSAFLEHRMLRIAPGTVGKTRVLLGAVSGTRDARSPASFAGSVIAFSPRLEPACEVFTYSVDDRESVFTSRPYVQLNISGIPQGRSFRITYGTRRGTTVRSQATQDVTSGAPSIRIPIERGRNTVFFRASGISVGARYAFDVSTLERRDGSPPFGVYSGILQGVGSDIDVFRQHSAPVATDFFGRAQAVCSDVEGNP